MMWQPGDLVWGRQSRSTRWWPAVVAAADDARLAVRPRAVHTIPLIWGGDNNPHSWQVPAEGLVRAFDAAEAKAEQQRLETCGGGADGAYSSALAQALSGELTHIGANDGSVRCEVCGSAGDAETMLLCDRCDRGYHTGCLQLGAVPDGEWYCPPCAEKVQRKRARTGRGTGIWEVRT